MFGSLTLKNLNYENKFIGQLKNILNLKYLRMYEERGKLKSRFFFCLVPKKVVLSFLQACNVIMNVIFVYNESCTNRF